MKRKCKHPGCITILNSVNKNACCHVHQTCWIDELNDKIDKYERQIYLYNLRIKQNKDVMINFKRIERARRHIEIIRGKLNKTYMEVSE